jgi:hypothetical protein
MTSSVDYSKITEKEFTQYEHIFELMKLNPDILNKKSIYKIMSTNFSTRKQLLDFLVNSIEITTTIKYVDTIRQFIDFGIPTVLSDLKYFIDAYVAKCYPHFSTQTNDLSFTLINQDSFWKLTYYIILMITDDKDKFGNLVKLVKENNINVSLDFLWTIYDDFQKKPL